MKKRRRKCGVVKTLEEFYRAMGTRDGYRGDCKACNAAASRVRYQADPAVAVARVKRWQQANPERVNAYRRQCRADPQVKRAERSSSLQRQYGLTVDGYEAMLEQQDGGCGICGRAPSESYSLHVDHDHRTGRIRGLLCFVCNSSMGELDDFDLLWAVLRYVGPGVDVERDPLIEARLAELTARRLAS
ncbi:MAG: endonuclease VII domain-containing protein [Acidimicrobiales bacterium]